jgi:hypothetical protein
VRIVHNEALESLRRSLVQLFPGAKHGDWMAHLSLFYAHDTVGDCDIKLVPIDDMMYDDIGI